MSTKYINPKLPSMIRNLHKGDPSMNSVKTLLGLAADLVQELIDLRAEQGETEKPSERIHQLIHDLTDPGECWFDHHGGCQEHGYLTLQPGEKCPHAEARELLAEWAVPDTTNNESEGKA